QLQALTLSGGVGECFYHGAEQAPFRYGDIGPLLAAAIIVPYGQGHVAWFGLFSVFAIGVLYGLSRWYRNHLNLFQLK
ncbi:ethanolamine ammonia-lyase reactivating factor EutA, partial [Paenibacillus polymyxa]|nr:ethanolamine ammonia-lyase reactivating factor EutA [Paenibacillus polymyxa]